MLCEVSEANTLRGSEADGNEPDSTYCTHGVRTVYLSTICMVEYA